MVYVAKIYPRSSLLIRSIETGAGAVDSDYRRTIKVVLHNLSNKQVEFNIGDIIAQVIFEKIALPILDEVNKFSD